MEGLEQEIHEELPQEYEPKENKEKNPFSDKKTEKFPFIIIFSVVIILLVIMAITLIIKKRKK